VQAPDGYTPVTEYVPDYAGAAFGAAPAEQTEADRAQRFVVEVQRSLDLWDRTWSHLPLSSVRVFAGARSAELATWLERESGIAVTPLVLEPLFSGLQNTPEIERAVCLPLLGLLLRPESRAL
jgi:MSHA biogenesis protein MshI